MNYNPDIAISTMILLGSLLVCFMSYLLFKARSSIVNYSARSQYNVIASSIIGIVAMMYVSFTRSLENSTIHVLFLGLLAFAINIFVTFHTAPKKRKM